MSYDWEKDYLSKRTKELKDYIKRMKSKNEKEIAFLAEKLLELCEFQLLMLKYIE